MMDWTWIINTGTNESITKFVLNNIILVGVLLKVLKEIAKYTKTKLDDRLVKIGENGVDAITPD